jgi:CheY-like chemotaxis protein
MDTKTPRFLLVDDDHLIQNIYSLKFVKAGFDFHGLSTIDGDFINKVIEISPDVILMDIHFEGSQSNGVVAAESLLLNEQTKNIPIIFFTNADIEEFAKQAKKLQTSIGFLIKSELTPDEMIAKVEELYKTYQERKIS